MSESLRVSVIGKFFADSFAACVANGFEALGHHVHKLDDQLFLSSLPLARLRMVWTLAFDRVPGLRQAAARFVARRVISNRPDVVVSVSKTLHPDAVTEIKAATDAKTVFWFPDSVANLGRQYFLASPFDLYCFKDPFLVDMIGRKLGMPTVFLPQAAPRIARQGALPSPECDLLIACNFYPFRARLMETLEDFRWQIYGNVPPWLHSSMLRYHSGRYLAGDHKIDAYRRAAIVFNSRHYSEVGGVNERVFEVCGAGAFLLTDECPALSEYYEPDVEVGVYSGVDDLREKVRFYLDRPALREKMALRAQQRTAHEHRYEHRVQRLLTLAGIQ